ncbi:putative ribonuclease H-like domain-containing protein [Tanacetum coccineum]
MAFLFLGPNRLASPRVNGYLVKASSNPFTFYDSPLPGVNTPWDVMRIVNPFAAAAFVAVSILKVLKTDDLSRKLEVNSVKFQFRGGLLVPTGRFGINKWYQSFALRNFDLEDMELESTISGPVLQSFPYSNWVTKRTKEKTNEKNDVKARSLLLMAIPNEHQLTFSQYPDAKSMFAAIETRFGEQIHEDDLESKGFEVAASLLVECYNCHKLGHFAKECRAPRSKESQFRNQDNTRNEFEKVKQEKEGIEFKIEKFDKASKDLDQLLGSQITDKCKKGLGYSVVPPPHPLIYNRPNKLDLSYSGLDEFKELEFKSYGPKDSGPKDSEQESNVVCDKKSDNSKETLVEEQILQDTSSFVESLPNVDKETVFHVNKRGNQRNWNGHKSNQLSKEFVMYNKAFFISGSFNHLQINCDNYQRRGIVSRNNYSRVDAKTTHPSIPRNISPKAVLLKTGLTPLKTVRPVNTAHPKTAVHSAKSKTHFFKQAQSAAKRLFYKQTTLTRRSVHYYNGKARAVNTASGCSRHMTGNIAYLSDFKEFDGGYVAFGRGAYGGRITGKGTLKTDNLDFEDKQHRASCKSKVLNPITKPLFMLHMDLFGPTFMSSLMHKKYCLVVTDDYSRFTWVFFLTTKDETSEILKNFIKEIENSCLGKFDGKSDEGFFVGYSLSSKAFRVYNTRTRRVEENLHIGFLENKPMIEGNGPKWLFDIDSLTQSMNYVPVTAGTISNDSAGTSEEVSQDCIVMPIWKDTSYFDSPTKDVENGEPKTADDAQKQVEDGPNNENAEQERFADDSSTKDVNAIGQHVNTASPDVNTGSLKLNVVGPSVNTASSNEQDSTEDEPEVDLGNITNSYIVPTIPNTRIHKDHPIDNMIGEVKSTVQIKRMTKPTPKQGFLSDVYEQKIHDILNTCLYACFLSHIEPTSIAKALSDSSWVEVIQEELLQFKLQQVWILMDFPSRKTTIGTKWVFRNKKDKKGIVIKNKARLVAQGYRQEEGFKDSDHRDKVYKVVKALYGLHQAPREWSYVLDLKANEGISSDELSMGRTYFLSRMLVCLIPIRFTLERYTQVSYHALSRRAASERGFLSSHIIESGDAGCSISVWWSELGTFNEDGYSRHIRIVGGGPERSRHRYLDGGMSHHTVIHTDTGLSEQLESHDVIVVRRGGCGEYVLEMKSYFVWYYDRKIHGSVELAFLGYTQYMLLREECAEREWRLGLSSTSNGVAEVTHENDAFIDYWFAVLCIVRKRVCF